MRADEPPPDVESSTERYAARFAGPVGAWFLEVQRRALLAALEPLGGPLTVVDVGGGHGQLAPALADVGHDVTVIGSTPACGERLSRMANGQAVRFQVGDLLRLPLADRSVDVAVSFRILPHVRAPFRLLAELCRVARRAIVIDYPSRRSVNAMADALFGLKNRAERRTTRRFLTFDPDDVTAELLRHGFVASTSIPQFVWPMALHRLVGSRRVALMLETPVSPLRQRYGSPVVLRADRMSDDVARPEVTDLA